MSNETNMPLARGDVVAGRYQVERVIGAGGMGSVVAALDLETGTRVAVKCILPIHSRDPEVTARFAREARVTAWIKSEHVARVLDSGELRLPRGGQRASYLVMEHLEGRDLKSLVRCAGMLRVDEAAEYVSQACVALAEAHALGIVHRDLKPANLFRSFRPDGRPLVKVLDFGVAKFQSANVAGDDLQMTAPATSIGSRAYMSPEQMLSASEVDARGDVWSLGVILHYLLTETLPFEGETMAEVSLNILDGSPRPLRELRPELPAELEAVVLRCLQKSRDDRYASVVELARALEPFARGADSGARGQMASLTGEFPPVIGTWIALDSSRPAPPAATAPGSAPRRRAGWLVAAAGIGAALTLAASALALAELRPAEPAAAAQQLAPAR
jgi:serine/threonine-protein kinase